MCEVCDRRGISEEIERQSQVIIGYCPSCKDRTNMIIAAHRGPDQEIVRCLGCNQLLEHVFVVAPSTLAGINARDQERYQAEIAAERAKQQFNEKRAEAGAMAGFLSDLLKAKMGGGIVIVGNEADYPGDTPCQCEDCVALRKAGEAKRAQAAAPKENKVFGSAIPKAKPGRPKVDPKTKTEQVK